MRVRCFNTASVLIQLYCALQSSATLRVSIQLLFLFNIQVLSACLNGCGFNTASVLIQLRVNTETVSKSAFQYSFCSYSTLFCHFSEKNKESFNTASVLIQHLNPYLFSFSILFQYSFCSYSTKYADTPTSGMSEFQYSFCSYSTGSIAYRHSLHYVSIQLLFLFNYDLQGKTSLQIKFQYSFCSYSTIFIRSTRKNFAVSIQLLFLFNICELLELCSESSVSIQLLFLFNEIYPEGICILRCFNTASVLIQQIRKSTIKVPFPCFNTASVLIQLCHDCHTKEHQLFQYSFCSYSTYNIKTRRYLNGVSIQLLFLFNVLLLKRRSRINVSIQLLFLFNRTCRKLIRK